MTHAHDTDLSVVVSLEDGVGDSLEGPGLVPATRDLTA